MAYTLFLLYEFLGATDNDHVLLRNISACMYLYHIISNRFEPSLNPHVSNTSSQYCTGHSMLSISSWVNEIRLQQQADLHVTNKQTGNG